MVLASYAQCSGSGAAARQRRRRLGTLLRLTLGIDQDQPLRTVSGSGLA